MTLTGLTEAHLKRLYRKASDYLWSMRDKPYSTAKCFRMSGIVSRTGLELNRRLK